MAFLAVLATTSVFAAEIDPDLRVVIRLYDNSGFQGVEIQSVIDAATTILRAAEVDVGWFSCDAPFVRNPGHRCAAPLGGNELAVRFVESSLDSADVGCVHTGSLGELLLRPAKPLSQILHTLPQCRPQIVHGQSWW